MKKIYSLIAFISIMAFAFNAQSQTYISEDFSTFIDSVNPPLASGWKNIDSMPPAGQVWRFDNPNPRVLNSPFAGKVAILDSDWYGPGNTQDAYLTSGNFDASLATTVVLEFDHYHLNLNSTAEVEVWDGSQWNLAATFSGITTANTAHEVIDISAFAAGVSSAQIRFHYVGSYAWYWILDNIDVFQPVPDDLTTYSVDSLINGCSLDSIPISATVINVGSTTINTFSMNYTINGGTPVTENITATLLPADTFRYTFNQYANISAVGTYNIDVFTTSRYDVNNVNDTASGISEHLISVSTFPYIEGFETNNGGWTSGGINNSWQLGTPANAVINSAAGGTQAWVTNLVGDYNNNEISYVISPCYDFSSLGLPQIKMNIWIENENNWDGTILQSTIDGGQTWQTVGALNDPVFWYNGNANGMNAAVGSGVSWTGYSPLGNGGWILAEHDLTGLAGQSSVRLRILQATDGSVQEEGFAFDNILIQDAPSADAGVVEITRPTNGCGLTNADTVEVRIINAGSAAISNFGVSYRLNGAAAINETYTATINPGDTANYTFTTTVNLSTIGNYSIQAYTSLATDGNPLNDTSSTTVDNIPIVSVFPYNEGFETGNGGWTSGGTSNSWQLGTPANAIIVNAAGGTQAWVTNLTGLYNNNEISYVESACFDFSSLAQPQFKMNIWIETENGWDGAILQSSINGGSSWQTVGALNDPVNWYNGNANGMNTAVGVGDSWVGTSPLGFGWILAEHDLSGLGGQSAVRLRVLFASDGSVTRDGFAFDNVQVLDAPAADAKLIGISGPFSGCRLGAADSVRILIANVGSSPIDTVPVGYSVNSGQLRFDTSFVNILPGDTIEFTFDSTYDFSLSGTYNVFAAAYLNGDGNPINDTVSDNITNTINTLQSVPYLETFDVGFVSGTGFDNIGSSLSNGWSATPTGSPDFFWGARNSPTGSGGTGPDVDHTGNNGNFIYVEGSNGAAGSVAELYSPCIDLSSTTGPRLEFWYHKFGTNMATMYVDVFDGSSWVTIDSIAGSTQTANLDPYLNRNISLAAFSGTTIQVRFRSGPKTGFSTDMAIDDFRVFEPSAADAGVRDILSPATACGLGAAEDIIVLLENNGTAQLDTIPVAYRINQGTLVIDTSFAALLPGNTVSFTFGTTANLSANGTYVIEAFTNLAADGDRTNDTSATSVDNIPVVNFPYFEDFETSNGGWTASGVNSTWAWGQPAGIDISTAGSGVNAWVTNLTGPYNNSELSYLESPCIDLSNITIDPTLVFQHQYITESCCDEGWMEISTDAGLTWTKVLASSNAQNWYNNNVNQYWNDTSAAPRGSWATVRNDLVGAAGFSGVKIRFVFSSDGSVIEEGFGVDSISLDFVTGINETSDTKQALTIYPNPSEGMFTLRNDILNEDYNVSVYSISGRLVYDTKLTFKNSFEQQIDLSNQAKGVYFMRINNEKESYTEKIIIQ